MRGSAARRLAAVGARLLAHALLLALLAVASAQPSGPAEWLPSLEGWSLRVDLAVGSLAEWTAGDAALRGSLADAGVLAFVQATYRNPQGHFFRVAVYRHASREEALQAVLAAARLLTGPVRSRVGEVSFLDERRVLAKAGVYRIRVTALMSADSLYALATRLADALAGAER